MYTGHVAIALGVRGVRRDLPLWVLVAASQGCDWMEMLFDATGVRRQASLWSHAVPFVLVTAGAAAIVAGLWKRSVGAALVVLGVYLSHPVADLVTGLKPLWVGGPPVGLHFIERPVPDVIAQSILCVIGWALYSRSFHPGRAHRLVTLAPLVVLLWLQGVSDLVVYVRNTARRSPSGQVTR